MSDFKAEFYYNDSNYLEKIRTDLEFLKGSELSKAFKFSNESDPFLITPSKIVEKNKGKAISNNYFLSNGKVVIPLPSLIVKRIQRMQNFIKDHEKNGKTEHVVSRNSRLASPISQRKFNNKDVFHKQSDVIGKSILENYYREEIVYHVDFIIKSQVNDFIARQIDLNFDSVIEPLLVEIIQITLEEFESKKSKKNKDFNQEKNILNNKTGNKFSENIEKIENFEKNEGQKPKILEIDEKSDIKTKTKESFGIQDEEIKTDNRLIQENIEKTDLAKSRNLQNLKISENILRNMIEDLISELSLKDFCDSIIKSVVSEISKKASTDQKKRLTIILKNIEEEKLQDLIYQDLVSDFTNCEWLSELALNLLNSIQSLERKRTLEPLNTKNPNLHLELPDDNVFEVFTPGAHSPNEIHSINDSFQESFDEASQASEAITRVLAEGQKYGKYELQPMNENRNNVFETFSQYTDNLSDGYLKCIINPNDVPFVAETAEDPCWYWFKENSEILGCLVYSSFLSENFERIAAVHHISTINIALFSSLLEDSIVFLQQNSFNHVIFQYSTEPKGEIEKTLTIHNIKTGKISNP